MLTQAYVNKVMALENIKAWLESLPADHPGFMPASTCNCPLAVYMLEGCGYSVHVGIVCVWEYPTEGPELEPFDLPQDAQDMVECVDKDAVARRRISVQETIDIVKVLIEGRACS